MSGNADADAEGEGEGEGARKLSGHPCGLRTVRLFRLPIRYRRERPACGTQSNGPREELIDFVTL